MPYPWFQRRQPGQYFRLIIGGEIVKGICCGVKTVCGVERVLVIARGLRHFSIFTAVKVVESKVLSFVDAIT